MMVDFLLSAGLFVISCLVLIYTLSNLRRLSRQSQPDINGSSDEESSKALQERYWIASRTITAQCLFVLFAVTYGVPFFAVELSEIEVFGLSLPFYVGAQGSMLACLAISWIYNKQMDRIDRNLQVGDEW